MEFCCDFEDVVNLVQEKINGSPEETTLPNVFEMTPSEPFPAYEKIDKNLLVSEANRMSECFRKCEAEPTGLLSNKAEPADITSQTLSVTPDQENVSREILKLC